MTGYVCDIQWNEPQCNEIVESVSVTGTFDNWSCSNSAERTGNGFKQQIVSSQREAIEFKFVINGSDWRVSDKYEIVHDEHGNSNNHIGPESFVLLVEPIYNGKHGVSQVSDSKGSDLLTTGEDQIARDRIESNSHNLSDERALDRGESGRRSPSPDIAKHLLDFESIEVRGSENHAGAEATESAKADNANTASLALSMPDRIKCDRLCEADPSISPSGAQALCNDNITSQVAVNEQNEQGSGDANRIIPEGTTSVKEAKEPRDSAVHRVSESLEEFTEPKKIESLVDAVLGDTPIKGDKTNNSRFVTNVEKPCLIPAPGSGETPTKAVGDATQFKAPPNIKDRTEDESNTVETASGKETLGNVSRTNQEKCDGGSSTSRSSAVGNSDTLDNDKNKESTYTASGGKQIVRSLVDIALTGQEDGKDVPKSSIKAEDDKDVPKSCAQAKDDKDVPKSCAKAEDDKEKATEGLFEQGFPTSIREPETGDSSDMAAKDCAVLIDAPLKGRLVSGVAVLDFGAGPNHSQSDTPQSCEINEDEAEKVIDAKELSAEPGYFAGNKTAKVFEKEGAPLPSSCQVDESIAATSDRDVYPGLYPVPFTHGADHSTKRMSPPSPKLVFPSLHNFIPVARDQDSRSRGSFLKQGTSGWHPHSKDANPPIDMNSELDEQLEPDIVVPTVGPCQSSGSFAAVSIPSTSEDYHDLLRTLLSASSHDDQFATPGGSVYTPHHANDSLGTEKAEGTSVIDDENGDGDGKESTSKAAARNHAQAALAPDCVLPKNDASSKLFRSSLVSRIYNIFKS